jgi:hypothetical protein
MIGAPLLFWLPFGTIMVLRVSLLPLSHMLLVMLLVVVLWCCGSCCEGEGCW